MSEALDKVAKGWPELAEAAAPWLAVARALPATPAHVLNAIREFEAPLIGHEPFDIPTEHVIHAGMYARTIAMPAGMVITGTLMKQPTLVIVVGSARVLAGDEWLEFEGYNLIPASAGRKQVFESRSTVLITMVFATQAKTVEEAEAELTDEAGQLLSRRQDANVVVVTGE